MRWLLLSVLPLLEGDTAINGPMNQIEAGDLKAETLRKLRRQIDNYSTCYGT